MLSWEELPEVPSFLGITWITPSRVESVEIPSNKEGVLRSMGFGGYKEGFKVVMMFGRFAIDVEYVDRGLGSTGWEES